MMEQKCLEISQHAKERYSERIMGRTEKNEICLYVVQNNELIEERINKMIDFGEFIYCGKVNNDNYINIFVHDSWIIMTDRSNKKVITIYKVSLIDGDDVFNKLFVEKMITKIKGKKLLLEELKEKSKIERVMFKEKIDRNLNRIKEYEKFIKEFKNENESYTNLMKSSETELNIVEHEIKAIVENLVCKKF
ncbi:MAG: hypothetical protein CVU99_06695 [Firmicutes bacterium HGW-Firmicutes-4]|nr:MAG: hypothetical protein CVU99_06695 [Firmicutes bacterium HGW-Firmicutes-4]